MIQDEIMKLQTYKMFVGDDTVYINRDDVLKILKQEPCEDCISRQAVLDLFYNSWKHNGVGENYGELSIDALKALPSVTPKPKIGKWLAKSFHEVYCDNCGFDFDIMTNEFMDKMKYCPNCGAKMEVEHE